MNAVGASRDFRSLPAKPAPLKPVVRSIPQPKTTPPGSAPPDNPAKAPSVFSFKSAPPTVATESKAPDPSESTRLDDSESLSEQSPEAPEDLNEFFDNHQALDESDEEQPDPEEQRQYQTRRLEMLEGQYRCRLLLVENVLERLGAADQHLKQWDDSAPMHPQYQTIQSF